MKNKITLITALILLSIPYVIAESRIIGFHQLQFAANFSVNSSTLNIFTGNTSRMYITDSGLVGIGTTDPAAISDVAQGATTSANIDHNDTAFTDGLAWNMTSLNVTSVSGFPKSGFLVIGEEAVKYTGVNPTLNTFTGLTRGMLGTTASNHTNNTAVYYLASSVTRNTSLTPRTVVRSDGKVGIGTVSPGQELVVIGDLNVTGSSYLGEITLTAANVTVNSIYSKNGNLSFFNDSGDELVRIVSAGQMGIGVMNATSFLDLAAATTSVASLRIQGGSQPTSPYPGDLYSDGTDLFFYDGTGWQDLTSVSSAGGWTDDGAVVRLTSVTDKVGIGSATPSEKLTVSGNGTFTGDLFIGGNLIGPDDISGGILVGWADDGTIVRLSTSTDLVGVGTATPKYKLQVHNVSDDGGKALNISDVLYVNSSSGNVGIGTTAPGEKLFVQGNINATGNITSGTGTVFIDGTNSRIGIGTSSPTQALTISGNLNVTGISYLGETTINAENLTVNELIAQNENISFFNASKDEKMRILYNGNVGIGSTNPGYLLEVDGAFQADDLYSEDGTQGGTQTTGGLTFKNGLYTSGSISSNSISAGNTNITTTDDGDGYITMTEDNTEYIRLTGGNVGIGTTSPKYKLEISDTAANGKSANISNVLYVNESSGRFGIGATNPSSLIDISGGNLTLTNTTASPVYIKFSLGGYIYDNGTALVLGHS